MTDLLDFIRARYDEDAAEIAKHPGDHGCISDWEILATEESNYPAMSFLQIAKKRAEREVEAKRLLLDDITAERHLVVEGDCWFTCAAATEDRDGGECCNDNAGDDCDCGRDARVERRLRLLDLPYSDHADYREEWKP